MNRPVAMPAVVLSALMAALGAASIAAQGSQPAGADRYTPPRTAWGDPDLQGIWPSTHMVGVPFERDAKYGNRLFLTDAEFKEREAAATKQQQLDVLDFDINNPPPEIVALGDVGDGPLRRRTGSSAASRRVSRRSSSSQPAARRRR